MCTYIVANLFIFPLSFPFLPNIEMETNNQSNLIFISNPMTRIGITKFIPIQERKIEMKIKYSFSFSSNMYQTCSYSTKNFF